MSSSKPSRFVWFLKYHVLPWIYWNCMLKGCEWLARPTAPTDN